MPLDNAYFSPMGITGTHASPNLIAIGQGSTFDFAQDSDVFLHEFGHYVSGNAIGYNEGQLAVDSYGLSPWGGSIDEGIADYFACTLNDDSTLGEASLALLGAVRELTDTSKVCPDDVIGEVHEDGEIIGSLAWSLRSQIGVSKADALVWGALTLLTTGSSFGDFTRGLQMTANDLLTQGTLTEQDVMALETIIVERGMDDCDKVLAVSETNTRRTTMFGLDLLSQLFGASCSALRAGGISLQSLFHFEATPAAGDWGIRFTVDLNPSGGNDLQWGIYVRAGQHVGFTTSGFLPEPTAFDYSIENITDTHAEIVIDETSNPPFDPSQPYFMVIGHANCPTAVATISSGPPTEGAGGGGGGGGGGTTTGAGGNPAEPGPQDDSGCGCRVAGSQSSAPPWAALLGLSLAAAALRRRQGRA